MKEQANAAMPALSRRAFVGTAAAAAGVVAATSLAGCSSSGEKKEGEKDNTAADPFADCLLLARVPASPVEGVRARRQGRKS